MPDPYYFLYASLVGPDPDADRPISRSKSDKSDKGKTNDNGSSGFPDSKSKDKGGNDSEDELDAGEGQGQGQGQGQQEADADGDKEGRPKSQEGLTGEELHLLEDGKARFLTGTPVSSLYHLKDIDNSDAAFFVFPDLGVRKEGIYRLKLSLFEIVE